MSEKLLPNPESQPKCPWWEGLPLEEEARALIKAKVVGPKGSSEWVREQRAQALARHSQSVQAILNFIQNTPDLFSDLNAMSIVEARAFGYLTMTVKPQHCNSLMQSGLVETIIRLSKKQN